MFTIVGPDGTESGPADLATLQSWVAEGRIQIHTTIVDLATSQRIAAEFMPELESAFRSRPSQPSV